VTSKGEFEVPTRGAGESSLVRHFYRSILRRVPDLGGKAFWEAEAARVAGLGSNVNEVWFALSAAFYVSAEYAAFNRDNTGFVTDLYNTFFNRSPDGAVWGSPSVAIGPAGEIYYAFLQSVPGEPASVALAKSTDGGLTVPEPTGADGGGEDGPGGRGKAGGESAGGEVRGRAGGDHPLGGAVG